MNKMIIAICATSLLAVFAPSTSACFCVIPDLPKAYDQARAVFVGEVVEIIPPRASEGKRTIADRFYTLKFKVEKSWKGGFPPAEISVLSGQGDGCLSYPAVKVGEKYLVYADPILNDEVSPNKLMVITTCNRTALIPNLPNQTHPRSNNLEFSREDASQDLKALEKLSLGVNHHVTSNHRNQPEPKRRKP